MSQNDQLKPGDIVKMEVGGETLVLEPIPYGRLKKLFKIVFSVINEISSMEQKNVMFAVPEIFEKNLPEFCELAFNPKTHAFITEEWIEENLTILHIRQIAETLMTVNGIKDFLGRGGAKQISGEHGSPGKPGYDEGDILADSWVYHLLALSYGWTIAEIDRITWPMIMRLLKRLKESPSADMLLQGVLKGMTPPAIGKGMGGLPVKKGKVKRRNS